MHWALIATALFLSIASAYLILVIGWTAAKAFLVVVGSAVVLLVVLLGVVWILAPADERPTFLRAVGATMRDDLDDILRWLRFKR